MMNKAHFFKLISFTLIITATLLFVPNALPTEARTNIRLAGMPHEPIVSPLSEAQTSTSKRFELNSMALLDPSVTAALEAFYNSTNGPTWTNNTGWSFPPQSDPCTWYGLTCDVNGKLSKIILQDNGLSGTLPPEIGDLSDLTVLDLLNNQITGNIVPQLGNLSNLSILDLSRNLFIGPIPSELGNLTNLTSLSIYANDNLSGTSIPTSLGNLSKLAILQLSDDHLTGSIPTELSNLTKLENISLNNNQLTGTIPDFSALTMLNRFRIDGNKLSGDIPFWLFSNPNMVVLNLNKNQLTGQIPTQLSNLTLLEDFQVAYNQLGGEIPVAITTLSHLNTVSVDFNMLTASNPAVKTLLDTKNPGWDQSQTIAPVNLQIGKVSSSSIELSWDAIPYTADGGNYQVSYAATAGGPYSPGCTTTSKTDVTCIVGGLSPETNYYFVVQSFTPAHITATNDIQQNDLLSDYSQELSASSFPATICDSALDYSECQALYLLYNANGQNWTNRTNWLENATPCTWYGVTCNVDGSVTQLALGSNNLIGSIPHELSYLTNLQKLDLSANTLTGSIPTQLGSLVHLQNLDLSNNDLSGSIPTQFSGLTSLLDLKLSGNSLSGSIPTQLGSLVNFQNLDLSNNALSGSIPTQLGSLANLQTLNLSGNQLSGGIPTQLGSLANLVNLSLGSNQLNGSIPLQLASLANLQTLKLSNNAFSGTIPTELSTLTNVQTLDVGFNMLIASDANLINWLNSKQADWASTQTVPPTGLQTTVVNTNTLKVSWTPIAYTADGGYYEVGYSNNINGPFSQSGCTTADKTVSTCDVPNLAYHTSYYFAVRTFTPAHGLQQNALLSGFSTPAQGTTPTNDNFANSIIIPKPPYTSTVSNAAATLENLEQKGSCEGTTNIKKSVWYQYTAVGTENVTFTASGSTVVKGISIWTGSSLGSLTQVGCGSGATASASVTTIYGVTYYIRIGSSNGAGNNITLQVTAPHGAPLRNSFTTQTPTLTWNRVTNATRYEIQVSRSSAFTTLVFQMASVPADQLFFTTPQLAKGIYYWRVRAVRGTTPGAWSAFDSFVIQ